MGTRKRPAQWILFPSAIVVLVLLAAPAAAAQALEAVYQPGAPEIDGNVDDDYWADVEPVDLVANGFLDADAKRTIEVRLAHNGTDLFVTISWETSVGRHDGDYAMLAFANETVDRIRHGWSNPTPLADQYFISDRWQEDAGGCTTEGAAERAASDKQWTHEFRRPLAGDDCDLRARMGATVDLRIEVRENVQAPVHGDNFRWPQGSRDEPVTNDGETMADLRAQWGTLTFLSDGVEPEQDPSSPGGEPDDGGDGGDGDDGGDGGDGGSGSPTDGSAGESPAAAFVWVLAALVALVRGRRKA